MIAATTALSPGPRQETSICRAPYGPLRRCGAGAKALAAGSPAFGRCAPCKPGDPPPRLAPPPPKPRAVSGRHRGPIPGPSISERKTVMIIGNFTYNPAQDTYTGELSTLTVAARALPRVPRPTASVSAATRMNRGAQRQSTIPLQPPVNDTPLLTAARRTHRQSQTRSNNAQKTAC